MRRPDLDGAVVSGSDVIAGTVDDDESFSAQQVEALFEGVNVWIDPSARSEFVDAQPGENRTLSAVNERLVRVTLAVTLEYRVVAKSGRIESTEVVHYGASIGLPSGPSGTGTRLDTAGIDFR